MLYADYNATSPILPKVADRIEVFLRREFGNPSSTYHQLGRQARKAIELARSEVAAFVGANPDEIVFTSGGTESCAHALIGAARAAKGALRIVHSAVEHSAVREAAVFVSEICCNEATEVKVLPDGCLDITALNSSLETDQPTLLSIMAANNETGVIFPVSDLATQFGSAHSNENVIFHSDAVQLIGKAPFDFSSSQLDILSLSAHKFGGPKGIGALVLRSGCKWQPVIKGGGQEGGRRGGTEAVALIVGMAEAVKTRQEQIAQGALERVKQLRDEFEQLLQERVSDVQINGETANRLGNTSSILIAGINGLQLRSDLAERDVMIATGSACTAERYAPSHVLRAMGLSTVECLSTIRVSWGFESTADQVERLVDLISDLADKQRRDSGVLLEQRLVNNA